MLPNLEFGHLYKFVVSVGLVLMAASVVAPWLILHDSDVLRIPQTEINGLTPDAQQAVYLKQQDHLWLVENYKFVSVGLAIIGIVLVVYGLLKWQARQLVMDEREDLERDRSRVTVEQMSPQEVDQKLQNELNVSYEDVQGTGSEDSAGQTLSDDLPAEVNRRAFIADVIEVEREVFRAIEDGISTLSVQQHVRLNLREGSIFADLYAQSHSRDLPNLFVEVKVLRSSRAYASQIGQAFLQVSRAVKLLESQRISSLGLALFVVPDDAEVNSYLRVKSMADREGERYSAIFGPAVHWLVIRRGMLTMEPGHFAEMVLHALEDT